MDRAPETWEEARQAAHALAGSAGIMGGLAHEAAGIATLARRGDLAGRLQP